MLGWLSPKVSTCFQRGLGFVVGLPWLQAETRVRLELTGRVSRGAPWGGGWETEGGRRTCLELRAVWTQDRCKAAGRALTPAPSSLLEGRGTVGQATAAW